MIEILVSLLLLAVVIYVVNLIIGMLKLPSQAKQIIYIIIALIVLFYILNLLGLYSFPLK